MSDPRWQRLLRVKAAAWNRRRGWRSGWDRLEAAVRGAA